MIRVAIVDDQALIRTGLREILSKDPEFQVIAEGSKGEDALNIARREKPDVILLDISMPGGMSGIEALERMQHLEPKPRVLMVTQHEDLALLRSVIDGGALGYLSKGCDSEELKSAIRRAMQGRRYVSRELAQEMALASEVQTSANPFKALGPREMEVVLSQLHGERGVDVSERLHISAKTISTHKRRAMDKLGVKSDNDLLRLAITHGLVPELYVQKRAGAEEKRAEQDEKTA